MSEIKTAYERRDVDDREWEPRKPLTEYMAAEIDELRAKLEALEKQEPVGCMDNDGNTSDNNDSGCFPIKLFPAAGAAPVPKGWQLVPVKPTA